MKENATIIDQRNQKAAKIHLYQSLKLYKKTNEIHKMFTGQKG